LSTAPLNIDKRRHCQAIYGDTRETKLKVTAKEKEIQWLSK
jgi:hypothetical protein